MAQTLNPEGARRAQVIFVLPTEFPVTRRTFNWAPVAVGIVLVGTLGSWVLPCGVGARHWFRGEKQTLLDAWVRAPLSLHISPDVRPDACVGQRPPLRFPCKVITMRVHAH